MSKVQLVWSTPNMESKVAYIARVSNPNNQDNPKFEGLLNYMIRNQHWSPFEMVNVCMEIETTRDIARQILRHRSFTFQEFSQRYAESEDFVYSEARMQDEKNRQSSLPCTDKGTSDWWEDVQSDVLIESLAAYQTAISLGIAKEVARKVLPEGLTMTRMYMNGTLRSWIHYVTLRTDEATQKEHRKVAEQCKAILTDLCPTIMKIL